MDIYGSQLNLGGYKNGDRIWNISPDDFFVFHLAKNLYDNHSNLFSEKIEILKMVEYKVFNMAKGKSNDGKNLISKKDIWKYNEEEMKELHNKMLEYLWTIYIEGFRCLVRCPDRNLRHDDNAIREYESACERFYVFFNNDTYYDEPHPSIVSCNNVIENRDVIFRNILMRALKDQNDYVADNVSYIFLKHWLEFRKPYMHIEYRRIMESIIEEKHIDTADTNIPDCESPTSEDYQREENERKKEWDSMTKTGRFEEKGLRIFYKEEYESREDDYQWYMTCLKDPKIKETIERELSGKVGELMEGFRDYYDSISKDVNCIDHEDHEKYSEIISTLNEYLAVYTLDEMKKAIIESG